MTDDKKNGVVVKDDHNEFELMLDFLVMRYLQLN